jgi:hypothetical protein
VYSSELFTSFLSFDLETKLKKDISLFMTNKKHEGNSPMFFGGYESKEDINVPLTELSNSA